MGADKKPLTKEESAKVIEAAIRKAAKKPTGELTKADLEKVRELYLVDDQLTDVKELEKLTNLTELSLVDNQLTDVKGLEKLTQLTALSLGGNKLTSVKGLEKLTNLSKLLLGYNKLTDVEGLENTVVSVHCHDDLGLGVANSLAALEAGARQVECTINGIGERAGNASLEEIVMALRIRKDLTGHHTDIDSKELYRTSQLLSHITGIHPQPNKAIVGRNAFAHEAGIHQHGI